MRVSAPVLPLLDEILSSARTLFPVPFKIRPDKPQLDVGFISNRSINEN